MNNNDYTAVCFGEVLWDVLPDAKLPGGAPMNVAYHLNQLEMPTVMVSRVGKDQDGDDILQFIESKKVPTQYIQHDPEYATGKVLATLVNNNATYDILQPVAWDFIQYNMPLQKLVASVPHFIFGSLGARNPTSRQTLFELLEVAQEKILDINLRKPHFDQKTLEYLMQHANILKLNEDELSLLASWYGFKGSEKEQAMALQQKFRLDSIINTRGSKGAFVLREDAFAEHPGFKVKVADTIGSGDAFLAGYLSKVANHSALPEAVEFACAMGAFVAAHSGACPVYLKSEVETKMEEWKKTSMAI